MWRKFRTQSKPAAGWSLTTPKYLPSPLSALRSALTIALLSAGMIHAQAPPSTGIPFKALVHRAVTSQTYENLQNSLSVTQDDGRQDVSKFDMLIFDGKSELGADQDTELSTEITQALDHGEWVLAFDVTAGEKKRYIGPQIDFATADWSRSYLVRKVNDPDGHSAWRIIGSQYRDTITLKPPLLNPEKQIAFEDAEDILKRLQDPSAKNAPVASSLQATNVTPAQDSTDPLPPDSPIPAGLIHARWYYTSDPGAPLAMPQPAKRGDAAKQYYRLLVNYTITAFLNNDANASGDFQFVLTQIDGSINPTNGTGYFANMTKEERAWFDDRIRVTYEPYPQDNFIWVANAPQTANPTSTYSTSSGFTVGFSGRTPEASYNWSTTKTFEIPSWKVSSNSSGNNMNWNFRSGDPNADIAYNACSDVEGALNWFNTCGAFDNGYPNSDGVPNELSSGQNIFHASVVYRTKSVLKGFQQFLGYVTPNMVDLYCNVPFGALCASDPSWNTFANYLGAGPFINLSAVVPIPLHHITFSQNPAVAGRPVTGEVFLSSPAAVDTTVFLNSNSTHATVLDSTEVGTGHRGGTFQILTSPGGSGYATMKAYYADQSFQEQLQLKTYAPGDFLPPTTTITTQDTRWAQLVPIGKWVKGYQVRYAVTFVNAAGSETDRGPWTPWFSHEPFALPRLFNIPIDASGRAVKRKVYRQFYADVEDANPEAGVEFVGELDNNTATELQDEYPN
jgi:hypothetical protein